MLIVNSALRYVILQPPQLLFGYRGTYTSTAGATSYTFNGCSLGPANPNRLVIVGAHAGGAKAITALTVGGISASNTVSVTSTGNVIYLWQAAVPTSIMADVVVTAAATPTDCIVHVWSGCPTSTTAVDSVSGLSNVGADITLTDLAKTSGGFTCLLGCMVIANKNTTITQNGVEPVTEDYDKVLGGADRTCAASHVNTATTTVDDYVAAFNAPGSDTLFVGASWA